ncbi:MAG: methyltransferase domain-containing protein [Chloroflexota bacterium]|nr:methyltransferase domain-containing protein [Chloroflexota bacterium]
MANVEMAKAWEEEGARWAEQAERYDLTVRRHSLRLLGAARISVDERILDIGCGCGETTRDAARIAVSGTVLGVDLSARMIERARERARAEGLTNVRFELADAQVYPFERAAFDLAISRFGVMFFADPLAAFRNVGRAMRPGGRLALLAWQGLKQNEWLLALRAALAMGRELPEPPVGGPGPFGLADADEVRRILAAAGFGEIHFEDVHEPMCFGSDADDAFAFVRTTGPAKGLLDGLDEAASSRALEALRAMLAAHETREGVLLASRAWLITARRRDLHNPPG